LNAIVLEGFAQESSAGMSATENRINTNHSILNPVNELRGQMTAGCDK